MTYPTDKQVEAAARGIVFAFAEGQNDPDALMGGVHETGSEFWGPGDPVLAWHDLVPNALAALTAAEPVLDREVVKRIVTEWLFVPQQIAWGRKSESDRFDLADAILASAMTREQVRREELERLADIAEDEALGIFDSYLSVADWLRSQIGDG